MLSLIGNKGKFQFSHLLLDKFSYCLDCPQSPFVWLPRTLDPPLLPSHLVLTLQAYSTMSSLLVFLVCLFFKTVWCISGCHWTPGPLLSSFWGLGLIACITRPSLYGLDGIQGLYTGSYTPSFSLPNSCYVGPIESHHHVPFRPLWHSGDSLIIANGHWLQWLFPVVCSQDCLDPAWSL